MLAGGVLSLMPRSLPSVSESQTCIWRASTSSTVEFMMWTFLAWFVLTLEAPKPDQPRARRHFLL